MAGEHFRFQRNGGRLSKGHHDRVADAHFIQSGGIRHARREILSARAFDGDGLSRLIHGFDGNHRANPPRIIGSRRCLRPRPACGFQHHGGRVRPLGCLSLPQHGSPASVPFVPKSRGIQSSQPTLWCVSIQPCNRNAAR